VGHPGKFVDAFFLLDEWSPLLAVQMFCAPLPDKLHAWTYPNLNSQPMDERLDCLDIPIIFDNHCAEIWILNPFCSI
jgi:hypothetical protein